jgi:hypothetical protein
VLTRQLGLCTGSAIGLGAMPLSAERSRRVLGTDVIDRARRAASITDSARAVDLEFSDDEIAGCSAANAGVR